jgi:hypothetical protein
LATAALALAALAVAGPASPLQAPEEVSAAYNVYLNGTLVAVMNEHFEAGGGAYRIVSESRAAGALALFHRQRPRFVSEGTLADYGLRPRRFEGQRDESDARRVRAEFDWKAESLALVHDGRSETRLLPPRTQDRLSLLYQFMFLALDRSPIEIAMTDGRKLERYHYSVTPGVEIETPLGRLSTLHLVKLRRPDESVTEIWLSPAHRHLPVRILIRESDGSRYEQVATRLEVRP